MGRVLLHPPYSLDTSPCYLSPVSIFVAKFLTNKYLKNDDGVETVVNSYFVKKDTTRLHRSIVRARRRLKKCCGIKRQPFYRIKLYFEELMLVRRSYNGINPREFFYRYFCDSKMVAVILVQTDLGGKHATYIVRIFVSHKFLKTRDD